MRSRLKEMKEAAVAARKTGKKEEEEEEETVKEMEGVSVSLLQNLHE